MTQSGNGFIVRFGPFEADLAAGQLRKHGFRIKLQDQPFSILAAFLEHQGEVVTREQLRQRLWPEGTFVDFDNSLNAAINKLREALGDSADNPRYVETLPRRGYRFIAPIQGNGLPQQDTAVAAMTPLPHSPRTTADSAVQAASNPRGTIPVLAAQPTAAAPARMQRAGFLALLSALLAIVAVTGYFGMRKLAPRSSAASGKSMLAVLPFQNISGDATQDYIGDGLTEELIAQLSRLEPDRLGVIARSTAVHYRRSPKSIDEIARELGVQYALEGSVRRDGQRVRITASLVDTRDQTQIWAASYERDVKDVLAIQQDVASQVARSLALRLLSSEPSRGASTRSPEAYDAYIRARFLWGKRTPESVQKSIQLYQQAIQRDPSYALAYSGLADSYLIWGGRLAGLPADVAYGRARAAVQKALELDESNAQAHIARSAILFDHDWNFAESEKSLRRGLELNPSYAFGHQWNAEFLAANGRHEEALQAIDRSLELDPFSLSSNLVRGLILMYLHRYDDSVSQFRKLAEIDSRFMGAYASLARVYRLQGRHDEWFAAYYKWLALLDEKPEELERYSNAYRAGGMNATLRLRLRMLTTNADRIYGAPYAIARIYAVLGEKGAAFQWLARAAQQRDDFVTHITVDPELDPLRSDPRFQRLLQRIGFPQAQKR